MTDREKFEREIMTTYDEGDECVKGIIEHALMTVRGFDGLTDDEQILKLYHGLDDKNKVMARNILIYLGYFKTLPDNEDFMADFLRSAVRAKEASA